MIFDKNTVIGQSVSADTLTIAPGVVLSAPEGKLLTLTSEGRETPIAPGTYAGAVLTVTEDFPCPVDGFDTRGYRAALYVKDGEILPERSVQSALTGGSADGSALRGVSVRSDGPEFGGVIVENGSYAISGLNLELNGHGGNDFSGKGTGLLFTGDAKVEADGLRVRNHGVIRNAVTVADNASVVFRGADIEVSGGTEAEREEAEKALGGMTGVPWVLGLRGSNRATNVVGSGSASYIDSRVRSDGWGVLSTDGVDMPKSFGDYCVRLSAVNTDIEITGDSGYGSYAIGACRNSFDNCRIKVPDYALIVANEYAASDFINGTAVSSGRFGLMWHANQNGVTNIDGAVFHTGKTAFLVKGCYPELHVSNSEITAGNGVILQLMDNDDPGQYHGLYEIKVDEAVPEKDETHDVSSENFCDCRMFTFDLEHYSTDMKAYFSDMELEGDFYNATTNACRVGMVFPEGPPPEQPEDAPEPEEGAAPPPLPPSTERPINLILSLKNVKLKGDISASRAKHKNPVITRETNTELGEVTNTPCPAVNNGVIVRLDGDTEWTVRTTCCLTALELAPGAKINAASMTVDGKPTPIAPGSYKGEIVIKA